MLTKTQADQIIRNRFGDAFKPLGFKWVTKADAFWRARPYGAGAFMVMHVNLGAQLTGKQHKLTERMRVWILGALYELTFAHYHPRHPPPTAKPTSRANHSA